VLLELAMAAVTDVLPGTVRTVVSAKFTSPLLPDVSCRVLIRQREDGRIEARCTEGSRAIMTAVFETME